MKAEAYDFFQVVGRWISDVTGDDREVAFIYQRLSVLITGRICRRQLCRYCFYSRADFEVFRPARATRCTDQGQIWQGGADRRSSLPNLTLIGLGVGV